MNNLCTIDTVDDVASQKALTVNSKMEKLCTVDTVNGNSHTVDTVVLAMKNACKNLSYSNNPHITLELNSHIDPELNSGSEEHTDHDLISSQYTDHDLTLGSEQNRISYFIKTLNYTQKMMEKFLNMRSSTKVSNSVDLGQCISRDLGGLNQDQVIQITNKDEHFGFDKDEHFGPDKDEFYMPDK
jgi:hypothetical protein